MKYLILALLCVSCGFKVPDVQTPGRSFKMILWGSSDGRDSDMAFATEGDPEPSIPYALNITRWNRPDFTLSGYNPGKIVAFIIDEPFWDASSSTNEPCGNPDIINAQVNLNATIANLKVYAPSALIWINFSPPEMDWQIYYNCGINLLAANADVFSVDLYWAPVPTQYYDWLLANKTSNQRLAMILGTFYRDGQDDQGTVAGYMQGYFDYAGAHPEVWAVAGWSSQTFEQGGVMWRGEFDPVSTLLHLEWSREQALSYPSAYYW